MAHPDPIQWTKLVGSGKTFVASTAVAGVAPGTALSTTPPMALYNPTLSTVRLAIQQVSIGYVSGTLGAGTILYAKHGAQAADPTTGAELTPVCTLVGKADDAVAKAFQGSTISGTPTILRAAFGLGASLASTAVNPWQAKDEVNGEFIILPGYVFVVQGLTAAGSTPLVLISVTWTELPV
jgi:hypothetical protein